MTTNHPHVTVGAGTAVHLGYTTATGFIFTGCGSEGVGRRMVRLHKTSAPVTCKRCLVNVERIEAAKCEGDAS